MVLRVVGNVEFNSIIEAVSRVNTQNTIDTADGSSFTFSGVDFNTASTDRQILVCVHSSRSFGGAPISAPNGMTMGGVSGSLIVQSDNGSVSGHAGIWLASVPTGATGDVVVTFDDSQVSCRIHVYACFGMATTASDTGIDITSPLSTGATIDCPANGAVFACCYGSSGDISEWAWTGLTEDSQLGPTESILTSSSSELFSTIQSNITVSVAETGTANNPKLVVASFGPST